MPALEKARLMEIDADEAAKPVSGSEIPVQFNPQSLKLSLANKVDAQETRGQQLRQYLGKTSTTLSFELQFDTSDEGSTDSPVSVRTRTSAIERFVLPKGEGKQKQKPPKARFIWKDLQIDGIIEDLSIDFDLFAADGTPLRAKMSVTMKEQDAKYQRGKLGPGANTAGGARAPGIGSAGPGSFGASVGLNAGVGLSGGIGLSAGISAGAGFTDSTRLALSGESAAEFAARAGLDPAAWRGVTAGMDSTLSLKAGAEVDFNASLSSGGGVGVTVGVESGASSSPEAALGLDVRGAVPTAAGIALGGPGASAGFALAAAGGVTAAIETVKTLKANDAASAAKVAFSPSLKVTLSPSLSSVAHVRPEQSRGPLAIGGIPSASTQMAAPSAPPPPAADARAVSFGFGVPLRDRVNVGGATLRNSALGGRLPLLPHARVTDILQPNPDPTAAPWTHLPTDASRKTADAVQSRRRPARPCGCLGHCSHRRS